MQINSIIIVGGGSSGWFTASALNKHVPEIDVTLIESPDVSTIGVGESTILTINEFFSGLEMKDEEWMPHCDATYKASIKFTDFYKKGEVFHYPFGSQDFENVKYGVDTWFFKKWLQPDTPQTDFAESFWPVMQMVNKNKVHSNEDGAIPHFNMTRDWAYQFNAAKLGIWMKTNLCSNTEYISDHVTNINLNEKGWISSLSTREHGELKADLYIDCTGFSSILFEKTLRVPYTSYRDMLINNGTWATRIPYINPNVEMDMTTNGTAIDNGWVWNIPLWDSISSGYVYSDKFIDKETALKEFKEHLKKTNLWCKNNDIEELEYRHIDIRTGVHEKAWDKNCIAIGLSYGFIEPLESTGLVFISHALHKLVLLLLTRDRHINQFDRDCFNREMRIDIDKRKYFVGFHFYGSVRDDTEYWRWYTQELEMENDWNNYSAGNYPALNKDESMDLSKIRLRELTANGLTDGMQCVAAGHHINLYSNFSRKLVDHYDPECPKEFWQLTHTEVFEYWKERNKKISLLADKSPTHYEYLKERLYGSNTKI